MTRSLRAALGAAALLLPVLAGAQNRALGRPTFSSGDYSPISTSPNAVDGNTDGNYGAGSTFHASTPQNGWWYVQLDQAYDIGTIEFWNRTDCCVDRIIGATLGIFDAAPYGPGSPAPVWSSTFIGSNAHQLFVTPIVSGRYVGIQAASSGDHWLQIAELEVFGSPTVTSTAPEPATVALLGGGLLALGAVARRRRSS